MMLYRVKQDRAYHSLDIAAQNEDSFYAKLTTAGLDFEQTRRLRPLADLWDKTWQFVPYLEDPDPHPGGLGELAIFGSRMIGAMTPAARALLQGLLGDVAEVLPATNGNGEMWLFNIVRVVDRDAVETLEESAVFRLNPIRHDVLCGPGFKSSVEASGLRGLAFREVRPNDDVPMI